MYKQPIVEQTHMMPSSMIMSGSGISSGSGNGKTEDIPVPGADPIGGD